MNFFEKELRIFRVDHRGDTVTLTLILFTPPVIKQLMNGRRNDDYHFYSVEISNNRRAEGEPVIILARLNKSDNRHF